ncbi:hypothetical protein BHE74_00012664 [Ensete ventricosum]|nr:hypothetical protein BHE74_00012664 [Ensete ventricosum]
MQFQVAGGPVAVESDLLGFGLGHRQGVRVQPERRLVAPLAVHPMGPLDLAHRCRRHRPCPPIQIQRQTCDGRSDRIGQRGGEAFETRGTSRHPSYCCALTDSEDAVTAENAPALGEPMDLMTALQLVMKKSLAHDGLVRGLHEAAKAIEKHAAQLCILAEDCNQADYVKLVKALCADHNVHLVTVPSAKTLGEWAGVSNLQQSYDHYAFF